MRTVRGTPECVLPNGQRFTATVTHNCEDADGAYIETTFVDVAPGRIEVLLRPYTDVTTVFSIKATDGLHRMFPRIQAWFAIALGRPFAVPQKDIAIDETSWTIRIRGYFDTTLRIQFDESVFDAASRLFSLGVRRSPMSPR